MSTHRVLFMPLYKEVVYEGPKTLLDAARESGVYIDSVCGGKGTCGKCRVRVLDGDANPLTDTECEVLQAEERMHGYRLACMTSITGDGTVSIPEAPGISQGIAKAFSNTIGRTNPAVRSYPLDMPAPTDLQTLAIGEIASRLRQQYGLQDLAADDAALRAAPGTPGSDAPGKINAHVWMDREIISVNHGEGRSLGAALDIGTTTVAFYVCDFRTGEAIVTRSLTNPQVRFGADVMSRIAFAARHGQEGVRRMQSELIGAINRAIEEAMQDNGLSVDDIRDMTVVGNTVMHHIFMGITPEHLGLWPFTPSVQGSLDRKARDFGILINPGAYIHILPVEAGFVGADNVGVLISEEPYNHDQMTLIIDIGTNGELVLGNRVSMLSCSCATGPAFEGAQISSGMRAVPGAVAKVKIDPENYEVDYLVIGNEAWKSQTSELPVRPTGICGSGIIDAVAELFRAGLVTHSGRFSRGKDVSRLQRRGDGSREFVLAFGHETSTGKPITITQKDIRQLQLAKAAIYAGCKLMMVRFNISEVDRMKIAGMFGLHVDVQNALEVGLFPYCSPDRISLVGNAAGRGAYLALMNIDKRVEADRIATWVTHVELALEERFQEEFLKALYIPYKN
jgi:uncharacterized 2Fe-2S/4Fe-4S cluster protein (DUF4445 family)